MAYYLMASSHYLNQCCPSLMTSYHMMSLGEQWWNPLCAECIRGNIKIYLNFQIFIHLQTCIWIFRYLFTLKHVAGWNFLSRKTITSHFTKSVPWLMMALCWKALLLKYGRPVAKCDPWIQRATQGPPMDGPFGDQWILYVLQKNISDEKWTDNSADALKSYPCFSTRLQYLHC